MSSTNSSNWDAFRQSSANEADQDAAQALALLSTNHNDPELTLQQPSGWPVPPIDPHLLTPFPLLQQRGGPTRTISQSPSFRVDPYSYSRGNSPQPSTQALLSPYGNSPYSSMPGTPRAQSSRSVSGAERSITNEPDETFRKGIDLSDYEAGKPPVWSLGGGLPEVLNRIRNNQKYCSGWLEKMTDVTKIWKCHNVRLHAPGTGGKFGPAEDPGVRCDAGQDVCRYQECMTCFTHDRRNGPPLDPGLHQTVIQLTAAHFVVPPRVGRIHEGNRLCAEKVQLKIHSQNDVVCDECQRELVVEGRMLQCEGGGMADLNCSRRYCEDCWLRSMDPTYQKESVVSNGQTFGGIGNGIQPHYLVRDNI
ncbi:hypothetical protein BJ508DRAFT_331304 [Ascobolus immersus RN42]|uniref:Uncharacterized protein n=1 Tax=Ascobolus immersus RN42 TaxID=1160509 RepID=A0A3N4HR93_ASCIM|nr:hypothetical protein BJ508DRAFT_331304 [Ascobolus immersus RN42]